MPLQSIACHCQVPGSPWVSHRVTVRGSLSSGAWDQRPRRNWELLVRRESQNEFMSCIEMHWDTLRYIESISADEPHETDETEYPKSKCADQPLRWHNQQHAEPTSFFEMSWAWRRGGPCRHSVSSWCQSQSLLQPLAVSFRPLKHCKLQNTIKHSAAC